MNSLRGRLVMAMTAGALVIVPATNMRAPRTVDARGNPDPKALYQKDSKEFYMTAEEFGYIRPGLKITVNSITINENRQPVADVSYTDDLDQPLDRAGKITAGPISMSFILAWWDPTSQNYTSYTTRVQTSSITGASATQASADSGGTWQDLDIGHSIYTFKTMLPANYSMTTTTTLGIYATRNMAGIQDKNYYDNVEQDFVPNGSTVTQVWDMIDNGACNTCHNPLSAHGGSRQDVKLCVLCHSPQTVDPDTGNTVDFRVMVHKIHMGENLPSVQAGNPYQIIGFGNSVIDFSTVVFPQDIRNCTTCHAPPATQAPNWYTYPTQAACGSCHDNINWTTGAGHPAGVQPRQRLRFVPHSPGRPRVGRLRAGRAHGSLQLDPAQGPERLDPLGHQHGARPEAGREIQAHGERRHGSSADAVRGEPQHRDGRPDDRLRDQSLPGARGRSRVRRNASPPTRSRTPFP